MTSDVKRWMNEALAEARRAAEEGEVPVGAVVVDHGQIVGRGRNQTGRRLDPTAHAEIIAIRDAAANLGSTHLPSATLYVTLEPCPMCAGAAVAARLAGIVFGAHDEKAGAAVTLYSIPHDSRLNHRCDVLGGILDDESLELLRHYFQNRRGRGDSEAIDDLHG